MLLTEERPRTRRLVKSFEALGREQFGDAWPGGDAIVQEMAKAMATTSGLLGSPSVAGDATPLRLENLDAVMTAVLFTESHLKLFSALPRVPSAQPLFQWIRELDYGTQRGAAGFREGGAPRVGVSKWQRGNITNKYLGVRRGYTHQLLVTQQMGGTFVDPVARENRNGTRQLLAMVERQILWGRKAILDKDGNEIHYDGIVKQMEDSSVASTQIIDKAGQPLDFEDLENAGEALVTTGKLLTFDTLRTFWSPRVLSDLAKLKYQAERKMLGTDVPQGYRPGTPLRGFATQHGELSFDDSIFLHPVEDGKPLATADADAPATPATCTGTVGGAGTAPKMTAGTVYYSASAVNDDGESTPKLSAAVVNETGKKTTVAVGATTSATAYRIYRGTKSDGSDARFIGYAIPASLGAAGSFDDLNEWQPGLGFGIIGNFAEEDVALAQMAPLIKWPLAIVNTTVEFLLLLYHVAVVKAPERIIIFKNIGQRA